MRTAKIALISALIAFAGTPALSQPGDFYSRTTFYSDATKTVVVGRETVMCDGSTVSSGVETTFTKRVWGFCP